MSNDLSPSPSPMRVNTEPEIVRRGAVAVIFRGPEMLVIRRSQTVAAPGRFCFPGGGIEPGETEIEALVRELREELNCEVRPVTRLWENVTPWRIHLAWWHAELVGDLPPRPNPAEVESLHWISLEAMAALPELLESNLRFVEAVRRGEIRLPQAQ